MNACQCHIKHSFEQVLYLCCLRIKNWFEYKQSINFARSFTKISIDGAGRYLIGPHIATRKITLIQSIPHDKPLAGRGDIGSARPIVPPCRDAGKNENA